MINNNNFSKDSSNLFINLYDNAINLFKKQKINESENYYKNKCEIIKEKSSNLKNYLKEYSDPPFGGGEPIEPVGDSGPLLARKEFQIPNGGNPQNWPFITPENYQQIIQMLLGWLGNPPSWWNINYWPINPDQQSTLATSWGNFVNALIIAVDRAGCSGANCNLNPGFDRGPELYFAVMQKFYERTSAVHGSPKPFPLQYQARYHPVPDSNVQIAMRDWDAGSNYNI